MENLFHSSISSNQKYYSSLVELEVSNHIQRRPPRHIIVRETCSHRQKRAFSHNNNVPKVCNIKPESKSTLAVDILRYQLNDYDTQKKHLENLCCNSQHRLEAAKASGNRNLINLIQAEYRELNNIF